METLLDDIETNEIEIKQTRNSSINLMHFYDIDDLLTEIDKLEDYVTIVDTSTLNPLESESEEILQEILSEGNTDVSNCLALTLKDDYKLISFKNLTGKTTRMILKASGIGIALTLIKCLL